MMGVRTLIMSCGAAVLCAGTLIPGSAAVADDGFTTEQVHSIEQIVRDYILANPEIVKEANDLLKAREEERKQAHARELINAHRDELVNDSHSFVAGNPDGDVTVVEFFDYRCPYCRGWQPKITAMLKEDPNLRLVLKEYPILRPDSLTAARAAIASIPQGKYHEFHIALMEAKGTLTEEAVLAIAAEVGLDSDQLKKDMADPAVQKAIDENKQLAGELELLGTPTFIVGDQFFEPWLSVDDFKAAIAAQRTSG